MFNLADTDVLEATASVDAKIKFTVSGHDAGATPEIISNQGLVGDGNTEIYTAEGATRIYSFTAHNSHDAAVTLTLHKDPLGANGAVWPYFTILLGVGYDLVFDGSKCQVLNLEGELLCGFPSPLGPLKGGTGLSSYSKGDLLYAASANVLGALPIGGANEKMFANPAGDLPEWAVGIKLEKFSRDTSLDSGLQVISDVGFKPSHIIFFAAIDGTPQMSIGFDDGTLHRGIGDSHQITVNDWEVINSYSIDLVQGAGVTYRGQVTVLGVDGFTVSWTKTGEKTGTATIHYLAFR